MYEFFDASFCVSKSQNEEDFFFSTGDIVFDARLKEVVGRIDLCTMEVKRVVAWCRNVWCPCVAGRMCVCCGFVLLETVCYCHL